MLYIHFERQRFASVHNTLVDCKPAYIIYCHSEIFLFPVIVNDANDALRVSTDPVSFSQAGTGPETKNLASGQT